MRAAIFGHRAIAMPRKRDNFERSAPAAPGSPSDFGYGNPRRALISNTRLRLVCVIIDAHALRRRFPPPPAAIV
jgi:hypothetical protein